VGIRKGVINVRRIVTSLLIISAVSVLVIGATQAWFTDQKVLGANEVTTGDLEVRVGGGPLTVSNIEPKPEEEGSYVSAGVFWVRNVGDYDMKWRGKLNVTQNDHNVSNYLKVRAVMLTGTVASNKGLPSDCDYGPGPDTSTVLWSGTSLNDLTVDNTWILMDDPIYAFAPGYRACYEILVRMDPTAPNSVQNSVLKANLVIDATQRANPGWSQ